MRSRYGVFAAHVTTFEAQAADPKPPAAQGPDAEQAEDSRPQHRPTVTLSWTSLADCPDTANLEVDFHPSHEPVSMCRYSVAVHEAAAIAVGAVLRALVAGGFYAERDLSGALRLAAVAVTELPNSMVRHVSILESIVLYAPHTLRQLQPPQHP